jgi:hypothetical protein
MTPLNLKDIASIPILLEKVVKEKSKHCFLKPKGPVFFSNDQMLQDEFAKPVALDTRCFKLLQFGVDQIYGRVVESGADKEEIWLWKKENITHHEAETLNA